MNLGLDLGYNEVKGVADSRRFSFPSVVGTPNISRFSMNGGVNDIVIESDGRHWLVGTGTQTSRFVSRPEGRDWLTTDEYGLLIQAAMSELSTATSLELFVVSGLPVSFYETDVDKIKDRLLGEHKISRHDRKAQTFRVVDCRILMQGVGVALALALDSAGRLADSDIATGRLGVIDVGGKTTNFVSIYRLRDQPAETASIQVGGWDAVRDMADFLDRTYPGLDLKDHEISDMIRARSLNYDGETIDLSTVVDEILEPMGRSIVSKSSQLWNGGKRLDRIIVAGGGALLLGDMIRRELSRAVIADQPVFANATGYWKYANYLRSHG